MKDLAKGLLKLIGFIVLLAAIVGGVIFTLFVTIVDVGHNAMAPTMTLGDRVLVWKSEKFALGQVVLCEHPRQAGAYVMGRIVGRPGHTVNIEHGQLTIAGKTPHLGRTEVVDFHDAELGRTVRMRMTEEDILDRVHRIFVREGSTARMTRPHEVKSGLFLMNDNRTHRGEDSRYYGEVNPERCIGRIFMRLTATSPELGNEALDIIL